MASTTMTNGKQTIGAHPSLIQYFKALGYKIQEPQASDAAGLERKKSKQTKSTSEVEKK